MNGKETEKLIEKTLNADKPDIGVLSVAKEAMRRKRREPARTWYREALAYGTACCVAVFLLATGIIDMSAGGYSTGDSTRSGGFSSTESVEEALSSLGVGSSASRRASPYKIAGGSVLLLISGAAAVVQIQKRKQAKQ